MPDPRELLVNEEVCFRYRLVSAVLALELGGTAKSAAVRAVANEVHADETGQSRQVSERTLYRWLAAYAEHGLPGLERARRKPQPGSVVLPDALLDFVKDERELDRDASIPELLRRAEIKEIIASAKAFCRSTLWRTMQRAGIETRPRKIPPDTDQRRFRYPSRMMMHLVDFKHFRAGVHRAKRCAVYFLDDAHRYGLDVCVTTSEQPEVVLKLLDDILRGYGIMDILYWDGGPGFVDLDVLAVCVRIGIKTIRGKAGYPEGHGAIERFNRSAKARVLRSLDGAPDVDPDCDALTLRLRHDLFEVYNHLPHESLGMRTPHQCFHEDPRPFRPASSTVWLRERFTLTFERRVSKDHIVSVDSIDYEVPRGYSGEKVLLHRRLLERTAETDALYLRHREKLVRIHPVDLAENARARRAPRPEDEENDVSPVPQKSASQLAFERDLPPMVGPDGGYPDPNNDKER
jgi:transposase InsO family protein